LAQKQKRFWGLPHVQSATRKLGLPNTKNVFGVVIAAITFTISLGDTP